MFSSLVALCVGCFIFHFFHCKKEKKNLEFFTMLQMCFTLKGYFPSNPSKTYSSTNYFSIHYDLFLQQHFYSHHLFSFCSLLSSTENKYIFGLNPTNCLLTTPPVSSFILPTTYFFE